MFRQSLVPRLLVRYLITRMLWDMRQTMSLTHGVLPPDDRTVSRLHAEPLRRRR